MLVPTVGLLEVPFQQAFQSLAVSGLVAGHFVERSASLHALGFCAAAVPFFGFPKKIIAFFSPDFNRYSDKSRSFLSTIHFSKACECQEDIHFLIHFLEEVS